MNMNGIINMVIRIFMRKIINKGVNKGIDMAASRGKSNEQMTPEKRQQAKRGKELAHKAKKSTKLARRLGRF